MHRQPLDRRQFLAASLSSGLLAAAPSLTQVRGDAPADGQLRIGLIADVHQDVMHDGPQRVAAFVDAMRAADAHAIVNLGDFCVPHARNDAFLAAWNAFPGEKLHVLGNHDTDGGYRREQTVEYWGMPAKYYSRELHGLRIVVLDGNDPDGKSGYACNVNDEQLAWLEQELASVRQPIVALIHQPIDAYDMHVRSSRKVREVLARAHARLSSPVLAVFAGHAHLDYLKESDGIPHVQINSASYTWVGGKHANYPPEILEKFPTVASTCPYADPLWALVTFDYETGEIRLEGRETTWVGPDPWELGIGEDDYQRSRALSRPGISSRHLPLAV